VTKADANPSAGDAPAAVTSDAPPAGAASPDAAGVAPAPVLPRRLVHFRWDLDKTYLKTDFSTFRDLIRTFRQTAQEKRAVPGASMLLRELLGPSTVEEPRRVTFISGSPEQMRRVLSEKLRLDGIEPAAFISSQSAESFAVSISRPASGRHKLDALLSSRLRGQEVVEVLFGDDAERDAFIYSLYADIIEGRVGPDQLSDVLRLSGLYRSETQNILQRAAAVEPVPRGTVQRIFIHLDRRTPPGQFADFGARVVPIFNYFQAALILFGSSLLPVSSLLAVVDAMRGDSYTPVSLANSLQDVLRRGFVTLATVRRLEAEIALAAARSGESVSDFVVAFRDVIGGLETPERGEPPWLESIDFVGLAKRTHETTRRALIPGLPFWR
jgi:hypothetical protein